MDTKGRITKGRITEGRIYKRSNATKGRMLQKVETTEDRNFIRSNATKDRMLQKVEFPLVLKKSRIFCVFEFLFPPIIGCWINEKNKKNTEFKEKIVYSH